MLVVDNYIIHKSLKVERWLEENLFAAVESDRATVVVTAQNDNTTPSVPIHVAATGTDKPVYERCFAVPCQSTRVS